MDKGHSLLVKSNFEQKALEYDSFMQKCVPFYNEMLTHLVDSIPMDNNAKLTICDLGSGTGNLTQLLTDRFPNAKITCVDVSPMMTDMAKAKLNNESINFKIADFNQFEFTQKYDIIASSLALHHIEKDEDKKNFYQQIFQALNQGSVFLNADVVTGGSEALEAHLMEQWKDWLRQYHSEDDLMEMVINRYYEEDRPTSLSNHLRWLEEIGFSHTDVLWKRMKSAVYCAIK